MATIDTIFYGCEQLSPHNDGTFWANGDGSVRVQVRDGHWTQEGGHPVSIGANARAIYIEPGSTAREEFRNLTELLPALRAKGCVLPPAFTQRGLVTVLMPLLTEGQHANVSVRLAATPDNASGQLNGAKGRAYIVKYQGSVEAIRDGLEWRVRFTLQRKTAVDFFPLQLQGEQVVVNAPSPHGVKLTTLPLMMTRRDATWQLALAPSPLISTYLRIVGKAPPSNRTPIITRVIGAQQRGEIPALQELELAFVDYEIRRVKTSSSHRALAARLQSITSVAELAHLLQTSADPESIDAVVNVLINR